MTPPPGPTPPVASIVVPAYNREAYLARTLDSVLAQTMVEWELVVSDDGSTDGTRAIADRYADGDERIRVVGAANGGVARARNRGFAATDPRSEFVAFLDSDDRWLPDSLEVLVAALRERPELVSVYGLARCIDSDDQLYVGDDMVERMRERVEYRGWKLVPVTSDEPTTFAGLVYHNYPVTPGLHLVRRSVADGIGPFDPATDPADDWDMTLRISRLGPIGFLDQVVLEWRRHPDTLSSTSPRWRKAYYRVRAKALAAPDNTPEQRHLARVAYLADTRRMLSSVWSELGARRFREAAHGAAQVLDVVAHYLAAAGQDRLRRLRRPAGG